MPLLSSHHISSVCQHDYPIWRWMYKMRLARAVAGWIGCTHTNGAANHGKSCRGTTTLQELPPVVSSQVWKLVFTCQRYQSSQVFVHVCIVLVPLQVVPRDEVLNPLLDGFEVRLQHLHKHSKESDTMQAGITKTSLYEITDSTPMNKPIKLALVYVNDLVPSPRTNVIHTNS